MNTIEKHGSLEQAEFSFLLGQVEELIKQGRTPFYTGGFKKTDSEELLFVYRVPPIGHDSKKIASSYYT
jgi:hypothetical protein